MPQHGALPFAGAVAAIATRHAAGQVRSPGSLLCKMVELNDRGKLRLDRTLYVLADKLAAARGQDAPARRPRPG